MRKVTFASATHLQEDEKGIFCWWHSSARRNQNLQATDTTHSHHSHRHILHTINLGKNIPWGLYVLTCQNLGGRCIILYICTPLHIPLWHPYCSQAKLASNIIPLCYYAQPPNIHTLSKLQIHFSSLSLVIVLTPFTSCPEYNTLSPSLSIVVTAGKEKEGRGGVVSLGQGEEEGGLCFEKKVKTVGGEK